jgi:adenosylcobinamide-GDP ribazoletransferase
LPSFQDLISAFTLLTRLPVGLFGSGSADLARAVWAFPVVGLAVGLIGGLVYWALHSLGVPAWLGASWAYGAILAVTGAFHEDGLADTADGFGGGRTRERKLEIMRDSRIGTYGAVALTMSLIIRIGALVELDRPHLVLLALIAAAMAGRAGMILPLLALPPARADGMAAGLAEIPRWSAFLGLGLVLFLSGVAGVLGVAVVAVAAAAAVTQVARMQIGGHTGDVLGAAEVIVECTVLTVLATILR